MGETLHFYDGLKMIQSLDQEPGFQSFIKACCEKAGRVVRKQIYHHLPKQTDHVSCGMHWILFCRDLLTNSASNWTSLDASSSRVDYLLKIIVSLLNSNSLFLYLQFFFFFLFLSPKTRI